MLSRQFSKDRQDFFILKPERTNLAFLSELIADGRLRTVVDCVYPLPDVAEGLERMGEGHVQGKLAVRVP